VFIARLFIYGHNTIIVEVKSYVRLFFEEVFLTSFLSNLIITYFLYAILPKNIFLHIMCSISLQLLIAAEYNVS